jgi:hypothetical protein
MGWVKVCGGSGKTLQSGKLGLHLLSLTAVTDEQLQTSKTSFNGGILTNTNCARITLCIKGKVIP